MRLKVFHRDALADHLAALRRAGQANVVFTNGCFDLLHVGHLRYLWEARKQGDALIVAINSDDSVRRLKGPRRPILKLEERLQILAGLACVDFVTWFEEDDPVSLIEQLHPDALVKGANYSIDGVVGRELVESWGGEVRTLGLVEGRSSTNLIGRVLELRDQSA